MSCYKSVVLKEHSVELINEALEKGDEVISILPFDFKRVEIYFKCKSKAVSEEDLSKFNETLRSMWSDNGTKSE